jgi:FlgD Ig-like domain
MWPGESRWVQLPVFRAKPGARLQYELRGGRLSFSLSTASPLYLPIIRGVVVAVGTPGSGAVVVGTTLPPGGAVPGCCMVRVDTLATPGDTLSAWYTISTQTQPPQQSRWRIRIVVTAQPATHATRAAPINSLKVHPNPCNPSTTITFRTTTPMVVTLQVFDARGREVTRIDERLTGYKAHSITWNGTDAGGRTVPSGVYLVHLRAGSEVHTRKVIVLK